LPAIAGGFAFRLCHAGFLRQAALERRQTCGKAGTAKAGQTGAERDLIAAAILRARKAASLTQTQLAERIKTDQGNIARLERGRTQVTIRTLQRVAAATGHSHIVDFPSLPKNGKGSGTPETRLPQVQPWPPFVAYGILDQIENMRCRADARAPAALRLPVGGPPRLAPWSRPPAGIADTERWSPMNCYGTAGHPYTRLFEIERALRCRRCGARGQASPAVRLRPRD